MLIKKHKDEKNGYTVQGMQINLASINGLPKTYSSIENI